MLQIFNQTQAHTNFCGAMEAETIKNAVIPKNHKNRGNFYKITKLLSFAALLLFVVSCGGGAQQSSQKSKQTDWEKLNLQGKVKSYTEKKEGRLSTTFYTIFNEKGYIVEKGKYTALTPNKKEITEVREYDENDNLIKIIENKTKEIIYDERGRELERWIWNVRENKMMLSTKYRYESKGKNEDDIYVTNYTYGRMVGEVENRAVPNEEQLVKTVRYDKQGNVIWEMFYKDGEKNVLKEFAYEYDKRGNVVKKVEYNALNFPVSQANKEMEKKRDYRGHKIFEYQYDDNGLMTYHKTSYIAECHTSDDCKKENRRVSIFEEIYHFYDEMGNSINNEVSYDYDRQNNWIQKRERYTGHDIFREYTYFGSETEKEGSTASSEMTISISPKKPCYDGAPATLKIKGGVPFESGKPFIVETKRISGVKIDITQREFTKKGDTYSLELWFGSVTADNDDNSMLSKQQIIVTDSKGNKKTLNYESEYCP